MLGLWAQNTRLRNTVKAVKRADISEPVQHEWRRYLIAILGKDNVCRDVRAGVNQLPCLINNSANVAVLRVTGNSAEICIDVLGRGLRLTELIVRSIRERVQCRPVAVVDHTTCHTGGINVCVET